MFYCNDCADKRLWPIGIFRSYGMCEMCRKVALCSDLPSSLLGGLGKDDDDRG